MGLYSTTYKYAQNHPEEFWSEAAEQLVWQRRWDKVLDDNNSPFTKWFSGGKIIDYCDIKILVDTQPGEYGPVEDAHLIMNHILAHWFQNKLK